LVLMVWGMEHSVGNVEPGRAAVGSLPDHVTLRSDVAGIVRSGAA
jgi:hypothetical protein